MTLFWVIAGSVLQLFLALMLFMLAIFAGGGYVNKGELTTFQVSVLNFAIIALPSLCIIAGGIVIYQYLNNGSASSYWWHCLPVIGTTLYIIYGNSL